MEGILCGRCQESATSDAKFEFDWLTLEVADKRDYLCPECWKSFSRFMRGMPTWEPGRTG